MCQLCIACGKLLKEGDKVSVLVTSTYHVLKSTVAYALDKNDLVAISSTLAHVDCEKTDGKN